MGITSRRKAFHQDIDIALERLAGTLDRLHVLADAEDMTDIAVDNVELE
ncbi:MAG TPA: hypothetical protein PKY31_15670 [Spirochaetota bacterium]|nr:hypothetical protein [Spirochaetota bacterium]